MFFFAFVHLVLHITGWNGMRHEAVRIDNSARPSRKRREAMQDYDTIRMTDGQSRNAGIEALHQAKISTMMMILTTTILFQQFCITSVQSNELYHS